MTAAKITPSDRLSLTVFLAAVVHALVILGVGFSVDLPKPGREPPLIEITLAERFQPEAPKDYDYLAQANQDGGGESRSKERPRQRSEAAAPIEGSGQQAMEAATAQAAARPKQTEVVTTRNAPERADRQQSLPRPDQRQPSALDLIQAGRQMAQEEALEEQADSVFAKFPSKRRIDARTKAHHAAAYMHEWVDKVERVGNINYPEEARRRQLSGSLILEVTLKPDGSLHDLRVLRPSDHPVLDQAAMRIVRLASPFAPVPEQVLAGNDLLVITRTWEFAGSQRLSTH